MWIEGRGSVECNPTVKLAILGFSDKMYDYINRCYTVLFNT